jgi:hypothetical protein
VGTRVSTEHGCAIFNIGIRVPPRRWRQCLLPKVGSEVPDYMVSQSNINTAVNTTSIVAAGIRGKA